ncbi:MAG TPA: transglycosylase domain-containing protein, partial [Longimicrobiales bacterium]|nr:transglycosylase domain-containing protein [Longimicrobiales bacterium]
PTKTRAGLALVDRRGESLFARAHPARAYPSFESIPPVVWQTLLFIENRTILDPDQPRKNPAVEWPRLIRSSVDLGLRFLGREGSVSGASTLATQLEKFRHAPGGLTTSPWDKLTQMASASLRAYGSGPETLPARRRIVLDYLNSVPLAAQRGKGEVTGLGDGLHAWFGRDFIEANRLLATIPTEGQDGSRLPEPEQVLPQGKTMAAAFWASPPLGDGDPPGVARSPTSTPGGSAAPGPGGAEGGLQAQGAAYREVLSLFLAQRRPSYYLAQAEGAEALLRLTDRYLQILRDGGVISPELAGAAGASDAGVRDVAPRAGTESFVDGKGADAIRIELLDALAVSGLYDLDRLDLTVRTTLDGRAQRATNHFLQRMADAEFVAERGFAESRLLERGDPAEVVYSVVLHERTDSGSLVRIEADNLDAPFRVSESSLLELGSTAKLRTLATYLEVVAELHDRFSGLGPDSLARLTLSPKDELSRWTRSRVLAEPGIDLRALLEASMERRYSASPGERFLTGGGVQTFSNFDDTYGRRAVTVTEGFQQSVNLVFVRMMEDLVHYYVYRNPGSKAHVLDEPDSPLRRAYLTWFADREGSKFLDRFIPKFRGKGRSEILRTLVRERGLTPQRIAWVYRTVAPGASAQELEAVLRTVRPGPGLSEATVQDLFRRADPAPHTLADLGYLTSVHPLELWVARYLIEHPGASRMEILASSTGARQDAYRWLFRTSRKGAQDRRIRSLFEVEAFTEIHAVWQRHGYPFENLVPSLGTAIGSSGDRPSALAELVGIILNDGMRLPTYRVEELHFAEDT